MNISGLFKGSGIYQIVNLVSGKSYVGSAVNIGNRLRAHLRDLEGGQHHSYKLQMAWNKYGAEAFEVRILEEVDKAKLLEREQYWMDILQPFTNGYNIAPFANSTLGLRYSLEMLKSAYGEQYNGYDGFIDPEGNPIPPVVNLEQFSKERGLDPSSMNKLYRGVLGSHHGWTNVNGANLVDKTHLAKHWTEYPGWVSPAGEQVTIVNMRAFCKEHELDQPSMWKVMQGKYPQHKGWCYPVGGYTPKQRETRTWYGYVSPDGNQVVIEHLFKFSQEHGLSEAHMGRLRTGERKTHKGWTYNPALEKE